jgi:XRE family transcriptional regulator, regulator of sulfur utilization
MDLGGTIRKIRKAKRIIQIDFSAKCEISQTYLSEIENNKKTPNIKILERMCKCLEIPLPFLLFASYEENDIKIIPSRKREFAFLANDLRNIVEDLYVNV